MTRSQKLKRYAQPKSLPQRGQRLISISFIYISALARLLTWEKALYYVAALTHSTKPPVCWVWEPSEDSSWIAERSRRSIWFSNVKTKIKKDETRTRCSLVIRSPLFLPYFLVPLLVRTHNHHVAGFTSFAGLFGRFFESARKRNWVFFGEVKKHFDIL